MTRKLLFVLLLLFAAVAAFGQIQTVTRKPSTSTKASAKPTHTTPSAKKKTATQTRKQEAAPKRQQTPRRVLTPEEQQVIDNLIANMVYVEGGTFMMGATSEQEVSGKADNQPAHEVTLSSFSIGRYEVTQEEWQAVMGGSFRNDAKLPVVSRNWRECEEFIQKLNELTGKKFRFPTEAEWEYAARGGQKSQGYLYAGSNNIDSVAWYWGNAGSRLHPVGQKKANELGLYDMTGNVNEWCSDVYEKDYYSVSPKDNPQGPVGPEGPKYRVRRGSYRGGDKKECRIAMRDSFASWGGSDTTGFRLAW